MTEWRVKVDGTVEDELIDVDVVKREAPYPDSATAIISDVDGKRREKYPRGTLVEFEAREFGSANNFSTELTTIAAGPRERDEGGADVLEVECDDVDALLRGNDIKADLSGQFISSAVEQIFKDFTPIAFNSSNVDVQEDDQVTRSFRNERVDNVLELLSQQSAGEVWGVNDSLEGYFRPAETSTLSNSLDSGDIFAHDLPERGEAAINEARVFYNGGNDRITVDRSEDKRKLQNKLGTSDPVTLSQPIMLKNVTDADNAREKGNRQLKERSPTLVGQLSTRADSWLLDADPGDTVDVTIGDAGFSAEVRIAEIRYLWAEDRVDITFVETGEPMKSYEDDFQVRIEDTLKRVEMRPATEAAENDNVDNKARAIETEIRADVEISGDVDFDTPIDIGTLTNDGFAELRDGWINSSTASIDEIAVGTGSSTPSRTDTSLNSESESVAADVTTAGGGVVQVSPSSDFTTSDTIEEIAIKDTTQGLLLGRATTDEPVDPSGNFDGTFFITITDDSETKPVLTTVGQNTARDILADNSPSFSDEYAVGTGTSTDPSVGDTSLDNEVDSRALGNKIVASADSDSTFGDIVDIDATTPATVQNSNIELTQTAFVADAAADANVYNSSTTSDSSYNDGTAVNFTASAGNVLRFTFTTDHKIPAGNASFAVRAESADGYTVEALLYPENDSFDSVQFVPTSSLEWIAFSFDTGLKPGEHTFELRGELERGSAAQDQHFDVLAVYDDRHHTASSFDNTLDANGGYLDSPALYPNQIELTFDSVSLQESVSSATIDSTWTDTSDSQYLEINGRQSTNTDSTTESLGGTSLLTAEVGLSNYGSRSGETPLQNHKGQQLQDFRLSAGTTGLSKTDGGAVAVQIESDIPANVVDGTDLSESGTKAQDGDLQTRTRFAPVTIETDETVLNRETIYFAPEARNVNESDLDPEITNSEELSDVTNTANYQVAIGGLTREGQP
jgi:hypothetical protein